MAREESDSKFEELTIKNLGAGMSAQIDMSQIFKQRSKPLYDALERQHEKAIKALMTPEK